MLRSIKSPQRLPRQLHFHVDGTGTSSIVIGSKDATLTDNGVGDYTLTFTAPFTRNPVIVCTSITAGIVFNIAASSTSSVQILAKDTLGAATDCDFYCIVQGFDCADEY